MTFQEIVDEFDRLSLDEKRQVLEFLRRSIAKTIQSGIPSPADRTEETHNPDNSGDAGAATPSWRNEGSHGR